MNEHFGTVGSNMSKKFDNLNPNLLKDPLGFINRPSNIYSMMMFDTDHRETYKLISKLVNKNSCAYDLVSNKILKATIDIITPYLVVLFNKCIKGVFP